MGLRLHPQKGVNPHLTFCPGCGKDGKDLLLLGANDKVYTCQGCKQAHVGRPDNGACQKCKSRNLTLTREIGEHEKLPSSLCDECQQKQEASDEMVAAGGVYFRCAKCRSEGAVRPGHPLAEAVREKMGIKAPEPCGVELTSCPQCEGQ